MQLNQALFMLAGGSGFVPQPEIMRDDAFDPFDKDTLRLEPITIQLQVGNPIRSGVGGRAFLSRENVLQELNRLFVWRQSRQTKHHVSRPSLSPCPSVCPSGAGGPSSPQERPEHRLSLCGGGGVRGRPRLLQKQDGRGR